MKSIFVVGFPRSGTTFLQSIFMQSKEICSLPETHFFFKNFVSPLDRTLMPPIISDRLSLAVGQRGVRDLIKALKFLDEGVSNNVFSGIDVAAAFREFMVNYCNNNHYSAWVEKTPSHIRRVNIINKYFPDAKYVHIVRRFSPVLASWSNVGNCSRNPFAKHLSKIYRNWARDVVRTVYWVRKEPHRHFCVFYPNLITQRDSIVELFNDFFEINIPLIFNSKIVNKIIFEEEHWKDNNKKENIKLKKTDLDKDCILEAEIFFQDNVRLIKNLKNTFIEI